jgi:SEL1 protein
MIRKFFQTHLIFFLLGFSLLYFEGKAQQLYLPQDDNLQQTGDPQQNSHYQQATPTQPPENDKESRGDNSDDNKQNPQIDKGHESKRILTTTHSSLSQPQNANEWYVLGMQRLQRGQWSEGLDALERAAQGNDARAHQVLGDIASLYVTKHYTVDATHPFNVATELDERIQSQSPDSAHFSFPLTHETLNLHLASLSINLTKAWHHYAVAAKSGLPHAQTMWAFLSENFAPQSAFLSSALPRALLHYEFAAQGGDFDAQLILAYKYLYGLHVPKDCPKSAHYFYRAARTIALASRTGPGLKLNPEYVRLYDESRERSNEEEDVVLFYKYAADTGDVDAQVAMGLFYLQGGYGITRNYPKALHYFRQAAAQGDAMATCSLGWMYANGFGVAQDNLTAIKYYRQAIELGNVQAHTYLGVMYWHGWGVKQNRKEALRLWTKAAEHNHAEALLHLGLRYFTGVADSTASTDIPLVPRDHIKALNYFQRAAQSGHVMGLYWVGVMHLLGFGAPQSCQHAITFFRRIFERTYFHDVGRVAHFLYMNKHIESARLNYLRLAQQGHDLSQLNAAWLFERYLPQQSSSLIKSDTSTTEMPFSLHHNLTQNDHYRKALALYALAAEQGNGYAALKQGDYYYYGLGIEPEPATAAAHYLTASNLYQSQATFNLGYMHQFGLGLPQDFHLAKRYYDLSYEQHPEEAFLPAGLALIGLAVHFALHRYAQGFFGLSWDTFTIILLIGLIILTLILRSFVVR